MEDDVRIYHHDLAELTMWSRSAVDKHGVHVGHHHFESRHILRANSKGDVPAMYGVWLACHSLYRCTRLHLGALRDCVVARAELELHDVAWSRDHHVGHVGQLDAAHHHWDDDGSSSSRRAGSLRGSLSPNGDVLVDYQEVVSILRCKIGIWLVSCAYW